MMSEIATISRIITSLVILRMILPPHAIRISFPFSPDAKTCMRYFSGWLGSWHYVSTLHQLDMLDNGWELELYEVWKTRHRFHQVAVEARWLRLGSQMLFLGDSIGRNQMHSLMCLLSRVSFKFYNLSLGSYNYMLYDTWSTFDLSSLFFYNGG